jgi:hypothetical protein
MPGQDFIFPSYVLELDQTYRGTRMSRILSRVGSALAMANRSGTTRAIVGTCMMRGVGWWRSIVID